MALRNAYSDLLCIERDSNKITNEENGLYAVSLFDHPLHHRLDKHILSESNFRLNISEVKCTESSSLF